MAGSTPASRNGDNGDNGEFAMLAPADLHEDDARAELRVATVHR